MLRREQGKPIAEYRRRVFTNCEYAAPALARDERASRKMPVNSYLWRKTDELYFFMDIVRESGRV